MLCLKLGDFLLLLQTVNAVAPFNKELQVFLEFIFYGPDYLSSHFAGIVWNLRLKFAGVLVDSLDGWRIKFKLEIVREEFQLLSL